MEELEKLIRSIRPPDGAARLLAQLRWDSLAKPLGSLGSLEAMIVKLAALRDDEDVSIDKRALLVFCAIGFTVTALLLLFNKPVREL